MEKFLSDLKSHFSGILITLLVGIPASGVFIPKIFYFLSETFGNLAFWFVFFTALYFLAPLLVYLAIWWNKTEGWRQWFITLNSMMIGSLVSVLLSRTRTLPFHPVALLAILFMGSLFSLVITNTPTEKDPMESMASWQKEYLTKKSLLESIEWESVKQRKNEKLTALNEKGIQFSSQKETLLDTIRNENEVRFVFNSEAAAKDRDYAAVIEMVDRSYKVEDLKYKKQLVPFLRRIQSLGLIVFVLFSCILLLKIIRFYANKESVNVGVPVSLDEGFLLVTIFLMLPLLKPIQVESIKLERPSELMSLSNWDIASFTDNSKSEADYKTAVNHLGTDNTFNFSSTQPERPVEAGTENCSGCNEQLELLLEKLVNQLGDTIPIAFQQDPIYTEQLSQVFDAIREMDPATPGEFDDAVLKDILTVLERIEFDVEGLNVRNRLTFELLGRTILETNPSLSDSLRDRINNMLPTVDNKGES